MTKVTMRKFIIREDTVKKIREVMEDCEKRLYNPTAVKWVKDVLHDFDTGLCTLSPYMPTHLDLGNEECCGIFMGIAEDNGVICNECEMNINDAVKLLTIKEGDTVKVRAGLEGPPDEIHKIVRGKNGKLMLDDVMGTGLAELNPKAIQLNWKNKHKTRK